MIIDPKSNMCYHSNMKIKHLISILAIFSSCQLSMSPGKKPKTEIGYRPNPSICHDLNQIMQDHVGKIQNAFDGMPCGFLGSNPSNPQIQDRLMTLTHVMKHWLNVQFKKQSKPILNMKNNGYAATVYGICDPTHNRHLMSIIIFLFAQKIDDNNVTKFFKNFDRIYQYDGAFIYQSFNDFHDNNRWLAVLQLMYDQNLLTVTSEEAYVHLLHIAKKAIDSNRIQRRCKAMINMQNCIYLALIAFLYSHYDTVIETSKRYLSY